MVGQGVWTRRGVPQLCGLYKDFKYLGSIVNSSLTSDADVGKRIRSAAAAFGALRSALCNFAPEETLRGKVEVRTKRPLSKSTKAVYFSSLALLMAAASGRMAARQQNCHCSRPRPSSRPKAAAGGRVAAESFRTRSVRV